MSLLSSVAIRLLPFALVLRFGPNIVLGVNAPNATKVCCKPFTRVEINGTAFCFATITIPNDRATIGNYLCRNLHPHANLASFHSNTEVNAVYNFGPGITGLQYEFDEFSWRDGAPVDFTQWAYGYPNTNSSDAVVELGRDGYFRTVTLESSTSRTAFCKMEADHTECPECERCGVLFKTSQNSYCYQFVASAGGSTGVRDAIDNNICGKTYPGYESASIHSKEENEFIGKHQPGYYTLFTGLRVPPSKQSLPYEKKLFEWTDGTPVDYEHWAREENYYVKYVYPVNHTDPTSWQPWPYVSMSNGMQWYNLDYNTHWFQVVCKKSVKCDNM